MKATEPTCHAQDEHSRDVSNLSDTADTPTSPKRRGPLLGSDILAAALGSVFVFGGVINQVVYVAAMAISSHLRPDVQGDFAGFVYIMTEVMPFMAMILIFGTPMACIRRTRTIARGAIATAIAIAIILAGELSFLAPEPWGTCLRILPDPGWIVRDYLAPQWGTLTTMIQIILGVVLLSSFQRIRTTTETVPECSPPPAERVAKIVVIISFCVVWATSVFASTDMEHAQFAAAILPVSAGTATEMNNV